MSVSTASINEAGEALRVRVNARLEKYVEQAPGVPSQLRDAMAYSLLAGGKRLRPMLVLLACEACGGEAESAMPAACAIEMVHTYSLIHDDLPAMDDDELRRGRPTNHVVFGEGMAILAGDALLTLAFEVIAREITPAQTAAACCADLARAAGMAGMVGGQVADLEAEECPVKLLEELEAIHRRKTGALLACSLTMGARVAQAGDEELHRMASYGRALGLAFQITDDLLDVCGTAGNMGKNVNKDASRGKATYPSLLGEAASRQRAKEQILEACQWIEPFGERGRRLESLAHFVLERDH